MFTYSNDCTSCEDTCMCSCINLVGDIHVLVNIPNWTFCCDKWLER